MRATAQCLAPGFWRRSLDEFKRLSNTALKLEALRTPSSRFPLITFSEPSSIEACKVMSDADMGGFSRASLDFIPTKDDEPAHARFHGNISLELPPNRPEIQRTGYAAWRTKDRPPTMFGKALWDIDPYTYLALRIKSDGRKYFVNVQTESIVPTDLHQHRLYSRKPGEWETVLINWTEFVRTNHGLVVEPQREMLRQKVRTVGIGLIDRVPGPFDLSVSAMWATNETIEGRRATEKPQVSGRRVDGELEAGEPESIRKPPSPEKILL
ncbi:hypothetical protein W97_06805 [Coniosporium apollinis CBS 100218]|uniref:NADH:ubiquinone oxidoreductase intermediate-associated protein 30 domain-containing protein n=1 Tax=Coniosporium apollinis (strain CBS 100218) TaxID=1168221 RepID=R7Z0I9_CONA1|nr:uncharacterized protein W97_06805 [Coniosporium apollinis CBS 100218]EON67662.1 hypothetical protein W97_06805 [Coniosporium apollinis CBS 100218]